MPEFIIVLVSVSILFAIFWFFWFLISTPQRRRARKRSEALQNAGLELSFIYQGNLDPFTEEKDFPRQQLSLLCMGKTYRDVMRGLSSLGKTYLFEFSYETGSGDTLSTYRQTVAAFFVPDVSLPTFSVRPAKILQKILPLDILQKSNDVLRRNEVIFETHAAFSRAYQVKAQDEDALRSLFQPALLEQWEALPALEKWSVDGSGHWMIVFRDNTMILPEELRTFLRQAGEIASLLWHKD